MTEISSLPLFYECHSKHDNGGLPQTFPFHLFFDEELNMLRQKDTTELNDILQKIYVKGSLVEGSISSESGKIYVESILNYIKVNCKNINQANVLEIGCGKANIIKALKDNVKSITGLEPGDHGLVDGLEGVAIIRDFFPSEKITGSFDLIYHFAVLEHIADPVNFILQQKKQLNNDGLIIIGVPNCEPYYKTGDLSMFIHEHYNYFTIPALHKIAEKVGMSVIDVTVSEGMLFCCLSLKETVQPAASVSEDLHDLFLTVNDRFFNMLKERLTSIAMDKIAIYVPARALNILYILGLSGVRLVDDSTEIMGKYFPYLENPVENFDSLVSNPPEMLVIFSRTFGSRIHDKLAAKKELEHTTIIEIREIV